MFDFLKNSKEETALLIDIGNGTVTLSFAVFDGNKPPRFIYSIDKSFPVIEKLNASRLFTSLSSVLDELLKTAMKEGPKRAHFKKIQNTLVSVSSPWFTSKTKRINLTKEQPFLITKNFVDDILSKEEILFKNELGKVSGGDGFEIIEKSMVHTKINGYSLENSLGNKTRSFDAFLCMSALDKVIKDKVVGLISAHTHLPTQSITIHTFPLIAFSVVRDIFNLDTDYLLVDITSEVIDITFVQDEVIVQNLTLPSGRNFIIRQISKKFDFSPEISESTLHMYLAGKTDDETTTSIKEILTGIEKEWRIYFENALNELGTKITVPGKVYMTGNSDVTDLKLNFLKIPEENVVLLDKEKLSHLVAYDFGVKPDEFTGILAVFYKKIINLG